MSPFDPHVYRVRECRSLVLDFLNAVYPAGLAEEDLIGILLDLPEPIAEDLARRDLGYLQARKLVERHIEPSSAERRKITRWMLTADGVTFVERGKPWSDLEGS